MAPLDRPAAWEGLFPHRRRDDLYTENPMAEIADLYDDDPLAAARGAVNGTICGAIVWAVILWVLL